MKKLELKPGDTIEVLTPLEILKTLDNKGTSDNLPFMPEMIRFCGGKFKIKSRVEKTCIAGFKHGNLIVNGMREFEFNDVVFLDELRCDGSAHGDCQTGCMIFWKEGWLKKYSKDDEIVRIELKEVEKLEQILKTKNSSDSFTCQSTNLWSATVSISTTKRFFKLIKETYTKGISFYTAIKSIIIPLLRKFRRFNSEIVIKGGLKKTPSDSLNLQPGEIVEVKSFVDILKTLDKNGKNKGLEFNHSMKEYCGKQFRVRNRIERMIDEVTGKMIKISDSVILENSICKYEYMGFGCPRARFHFWREIWLKRVNS